MNAVIQFRLNGRPTSLVTDGKRSLLWALRGDLEMTGTKYGCGEGICGACTVLVSGTAVRACRFSVSDLDGKDVVTIEGLAQAGRLQPLQQAFIEHGALQCGFCTSGMLMAAHALLLERRHLTRADIALGLESNLCRCGAHQRILDAVESVVRQTGDRS